MITNVTTAQLKSYLRVDGGDEDDGLLTAIKGAAIAYICSYTGRGIEYIEQHEEFTAAFYVLCADMYDVRQMSVQSDKVNPTVKTILDMHIANGVG